MHSFSPWSTAPMVNDPVLDTWGPPCSVVKNPPAMQEPQELQVQPLGQEDPLDEEMATHSSIPAWKIPRTEEPAGLQSMGSQRGRHNFVGIGHLKIC